MASRSPPLHASQKRRTRSKGVSLTLPTSPRPRCWLLPLHSHLLPDDGSVLLDCSLLLDRSLLLGRHRGPPPLGRRRSLLLLDRGPLLLGRRRRPLLLGRRLGLLGRRLLLGP